MSKKHKDQPKGMRKRVRKGTGSYVSYRAEFRAFRNKVRKLVSYIRHSPLDKQAIMALERIRAVGMNTWKPRHQHPLQGWKG